MCPSKESANCRLELNYAVQNEDVDMIPLMMQNGYKARGWLGLIMGTRLYYKFVGDDLDDEAVFEARVESLAREIGDRGKQKLPEAVRPSQTQTRET